MEILCPRSVIITARFHHRGLRLRRNLRTCTFAARSFRCLNRRSQFRIVGSKRSVYQDFQGYAAPVRLFPTTEAKVPNGIPPGEMPKLYHKGDSQAMFKIMIRTSRMYGSSLSNDNSGVMLCIIDENGNSILQRIPAVSMDCSFSGESCVYSMVHFQQGSDDEFTFQGPKLGRIQAVWISIESGQWRLGGLGLSVIYPPSVEVHNTEEVQFTGFQYDFSTDDILLGEGDGSSMIELNPSRTVELSGSDPFVLLSRVSEESTSTITNQMSNEESMREYAALKVSLVLYDAALIVVGSSVLWFSWGLNSAIAFSTGGVGGFLYLLLLQRSVDELPSPASISRDSVDRIFSRFWGPTSTLAVSVAVVFLALKYSSGEDPVAFTPRELILGMMGFLACKVAVVLAAFKPLATSWDAPAD